MADSKTSALGEISVPALEDLLYAVDDPTGTPLSTKVSTNRFMAQGGFIPGGRLTLTTATPVTTSDVTAAGTLYYALYLHNKIRIYDGTRWKYYAFTEVSLSLTLTSGKNYDVFIYDNSGTLTLELSAAWTNDTTRADALTTQDGVQVKSGATSRLWLGTIRASGTNTTEDSAAKRFVWNQYNRIDRRLYKAFAGTSYTYATIDFRQANADTANQVEIVVGDASSLLDISGHQTVNPASGIRGNYICFGEDSTTLVSADALTAAVLASATVQATGVSLLHKIPALGYHKYPLLECAVSTSAATIWLTESIDSQTVQECGITGFIYA